MLCLIYVFSNDNTLALPTSSCGGGMTGFI